MAFAYDLQCNRIENDHEINKNKKKLKYSLFFFIFMIIFFQLHVSVYNRVILITLRLSTVLLKTVVH